MITIFHTADLHLRASRAEECFRSLETIQEEAKKQNPDVIAIAGDTWDGPIANSAGSMFNEFVERIRLLADIAPVVMIYGTPSHDAAGSLDIFSQVESRWGITILQPGVSYYLEKERVVANRGPSASLQIFGVPEPSKKWIMAEMKEAASEAARSALKSLFLGLAATKEKDLPTLLLYHGQVVGSKSATGWTADSSGMAVTYDELASVGADYIALGDIHEPQRIGDLQAYYPGSIYPTNWGETHQAGFNLVTIEDGDDLFEDHKVSVERIQLPQPQRVKIEATTNSMWSYESDVSGKLTWVEITCRAEDAPNIDHILDDLTTSRGALPGSRVTLNILPTETVRAGEIAEAEHLKDKLKIYLENSSQDVSKSILQKADELEAEAEKGASGHGGAAIRLDRLSLRGAIGINRGTGLETIEIDFRDYSPGLIGLIGSNGKGKTTLIENMHPWPSLLTRDGKLQDHFFLRDSWREIDFTDERTGVQYRSIMKIDGQNKSGSVEYYLYSRSGNSEWAPLPEINGRKEPYMIAIDSLFGSLSLYLRSAFISQRSTKGNPDLSDATKGERKSLFRELAGLDYLQGFSDTAREKEKSIMAEVNLNAGKLHVLDEQLSKKADLEGSFSQAKEDEAEKKKAIPPLQERYEAITAKEADLLKRMEKQEEAQKQRQEAEYKLGEVIHQIGELRDEIRTYERAVEKKGSAEKALSEYRDLTSKKQEIEKEFSRYQEKISHQKDAYYRKQKEANDERKRIEKLKTEKVIRQNALNTRINTIGEKLSEEVSDSCPTCGQSWPADRLEAWMDERKKLEEERDRHQKELIGINEAIGAYDAQIEGVEDPEEVYPVLFPRQGELEQINADLEWIEPDAEREVVSRAEVAHAKIEAAEEKIGMLEKQEAELSGAVRKLEEAVLVHGLQGALEDATTAREELQIEIERVTEEVRQITNNIDYYTRAIDELKETGKKAEKIRSESVKQKHDADEWGLLSRACGPDGIQALELDNLAPSIAQVANSLLQAAYDSRFRVEFRTTRIGGSGKKTKQIEDFLIYIHDTESGSEQELSTLSGGEGVWIKKAIYDAFGIIRAKNTGIQFLTAIQDEADGALDPEAKERFYRMIEEAHRQSGRSHTIIITHSREIQEMLIEKIVMDELTEASAKGAA